MSRAAFVSAILGISLAASIFAPVVANAQTENICKVADTQCGPQANTKTPCICIIPVGATAYIIKGICLHQNECKYTPASGVITAPTSMVPANADVSIFGATDQTVADLPFSAQSAIQSANSSWLDSVTGFMTKNPLITMIGVGAGMSLLTSLMSPSGSSGSGSNSAQMGVCTTQYYYSANPNPGDPCAVYSPNGTGSGSTLPTGAAPDTSIADLLSKLNTQPNVNINVASSTQPSISDLINNLTKCPITAFLVDCPSGSQQQDQGTDSNGCKLAPKCVTNLTGSTTCPLNITANCAAGFTAQAQGNDANGCPLPQKCVQSISTALSSSSGLTAANCGSGTCPSGTFCSTLSPGSCIPNGQVDCGNYSCNAGETCGAGSQCLSSSNQPSTGTSPSTPADTSTPVSVSDLISNQNLYNNTTSSSTPSPAQTPLNQKNIPVPANGLHGDLLSFGGGVTIYARSRSGNTEVSGFYGAPGAPVGLCQSRPWASNFLSYIIPPAFFDNLCAWAGFHGATGGSGGALFGGAGSTAVRTVAGPGSPSTPAQNAQSAIAPEAKIRASPASVRLGGRTTVFWVSKNVSSCAESSSDGNFHSSSTSGGASTVALSGPVTFYITCLGMDGQTVADSTVVNIGI